MINYGSLGVLCNCTSVLVTEGKLDLQIYMSNVPGNYYIHLL